MSDPVGTEKSKATATEEPDATETVDSAAEEVAEQEEQDGKQDEAAEKEARPLTKQEKRELLRVQTQKERRRRAGRQAFGLVGASLAVVAVIFGVIYFVNQGGDDPATEAAASAAPSEPAAEAPSQPAVPFPPVPAGADPALSTKPVVEKGQGDLKELKVTYVVRGTGTPTKDGDLITANYVGALYASAEEFDSSWNRQEAITFTLGAGQLIAGWEEGLKNVPVGSRIILDLPPDKAYGSEDDGSGRPTGPLRFVVDVLGAQPQ